VSSEKKKKKDGEGERERERERERRERKAPVSIKRSLRPSPFSRRLSAARLASKCIRLAFRLVKEAEEGARGGGGEAEEGAGRVDLEVCERVSPRARACTPLMAPSGYSRGTLSYLLFNAGRRRKREEKEKNRPRVRAAVEKGGRQAGRGRNEDLSANITRVADLPEIPSNTV